METSLSRVAEYIQDRRFIGQLSEPSGVGHASFSGQPPSTVLFLRAINGVVEDGRFQSSGCGFLVACCAASIQLALKRPLTECHDVTPQAIAEHLGGLPDNRRFCAELACEALQAAVAASLASSPIAVR